MSQVPQLNIRTKPTPRTGRLGTSNSQRNQTTMRSQRTQRTQPTQRSHRSHRSQAATHRSQRSQAATHRSNNSLRSARTPASVRSARSDASSYYDEEIDELELLREKREMLTQQLWGVMGDIQMANAKKAGYKIESLPKPLDVQVSRGTVKNAANALNEKNAHAYMRNRFGTTSQQSWCLETIAVQPQLVDNNRKFRRRVTDMTRYSEALAKSGPTPVPNRKKFPRRR